MLNELSLDGSLTWSNDRAAVLLTTGYHNCHIEMKEYMTLHGLNPDPTQVEVKSVSSGSGNYRSVENIWTGKTQTTKW